MNEMTADWENRLIHSVCGGATHFGGVSCTHYDFSAGECILLRERKMDDFWENGRCTPFDMLYRAVATYSDRFKDKYDYLPLDDKEDIDFCSIVERLRNYGLRRDFNLAGWSRYMNKAVYREIRGILVRRGLIPDEAICGTCKHLASSSPCICQKTGTFREKSDMICEFYEWPVRIFVPFDAGYTDYSKEDWTGGADDIMIMKEKMNRMKNMLANRALKMRSGSQKRKIYERQYEVFANSANLLSEGVPGRRLRTTLAKKSGVHVKTIRRDMRDIREFFLRNCHKA